MINGGIHNNNLDIIEFQPKDNDDMMQCVRSNIMSLFAPRLKILKKQVYPCGTRKKIQMSLISNLNSNTLN